MDKLVQPSRFKRMHLTSLTINFLRTRHPAMAIWCGFLFPGFGQWFLGSYFYGLVLMIWEFFINHMAKLNLAIYHSMIGEFELAKQTLNMKWFILYIAVYVFAVWDAYRVTLEINPRAKLSASKKTDLQPFSISSVSFNFLYKRNPWMVLIWSILLPGTGHFILQRQFLAIFALFWWIICCYKGNIPMAFQYTMQGEFANASNILDPQWLLYMPSLYTFAAYDSFLSALDLNRLFEKEQQDYLKRKYSGERIRRKLSQLHR